MKYEKPRAVIVVSASEAIQGGKGVELFLDSLAMHSDGAAYEADE